MGISNSCQAVERNYFLLRHCFFCSFFVLKEDISSENLKIMMLPEKWRYVSIYRNTYRPLEYLSSLVPLMDNTHISSHGYYWLHLTSKKHHRRFIFVLSLALHQQCFSTAIQVWNISWISSFSLRWGNRLSWSVQRTEHQPCSDSEVWPCPANTGERPHLTLSELPCSVNVNHKSEGLHWHQHSWPVLDCYHETCAFSANKTPCQGEESISSSAISSVVIVSTFWVCAAGSS